MTEARDLLRLALVASREAAVVFEAAIEESALSVALSEDRA